MTYFVDTSFFFALASVNDRDHVRMRDVFDEFDPKQLSEVWLTTDHVVMETIRLTKRQVGHETAVKMGKRLYTARSWRGSIGQLRRKNGMPSIIWPGTPISATAPWTA